jgi:hypothetical protein
MRSMEPFTCKGLCVYDLKLFPSKTYAVSKQNFCRNLLARPSPAVRTAFDHDKTWAEKESDSFKRFEIVNGLRRVDVTFGQRSRFRNAEIHNA